MLAGPQSQPGQSGRAVHGRVNVNTTDATAGATALLLPAQNTYTAVCERKHQETRETRQPVPCGATELFLPAQNTHTLHDPI